MRYIELTQGKQAIVDDEDFDMVSQYKWQYGLRGYAMHGNNGKKLYMHRLILNTPKDKVSDHINGNKLDNRRENLRLATQSQNQLNKLKLSNNTSGFKGVRWNKKDKNWQASICKIYIGSFNQVKQAALAYDLWAKDMFGEFAKTNFQVVGFGKH